MADPPEQPHQEIDPAAKGPSSGSAASAPAAASEETHAGVTKTPAAEASADTSAPQPERNIDQLLRQTEEALASVDNPTDAPLEGLAPFELRELSGAPASTEAATIDLIRDVELDLRIELGRTQMQLDEVLKLCKGSVVTLDKLAGDPVDVYVNGRLVARGEVLVLNDNFCVRVAELVAGDSV